MLLQKLGLALGNIDKPPQIMMFENRIWQAVFEICLGTDVLDALHGLRTWWLENRKTFMSDNLTRHWWANIGGVSLVY